MAETCFVGVNLGGTGIKFGLADQTGAMISNHSIPTNASRGPDDVLERITEMTRTLAGDFGGQLCGVGVGVTGLVDTDTGVTRFLPNLTTQWKGDCFEPRVTEWSNHN